MKKVIWIVVVVLVVLFISGSCSAYNRMVTAEESVNTTWADVEAQYQRRSDLIPNLVNTVKGYAAHEQATLPRWSKPVPRPCRSNWMQRT